MQFKIFSAMSVLVIAISVLPASLGANKGSTVVQAVTNKEASQKTSATNVAACTTGALMTDAGLVDTGYKIPQMFGHGKSKESVSVPGKNFHVL